MPGTSKIAIICCCIWLLMADFLAAQQAPLSTDSMASRQGFRKTSLFPLPVVYYTPETRWAGGLALFASFRLPGQSDSERPSQAQLGFAYTQRKQVLFYLPFQFFWDKERNQVNGELGYYRYTYLFYGIGNHNTTADEETYDVNFPRWRINVLRLVKPGHYLGLRYWLDDYRMQRTDPDGQLSGGQLTGSRGGVISGAGLLYSYDNRDDIFYPTRGFLVEVEHFLNRKELGSHFNFVRTSLDAAGYFSTDRKGVLALNVWMTHLTGEVPFQQLAFMGGPRKMRGYFEGIFRDKNLWMLQAEYRRNLYKRAGFVVFAGTGAVSPTIHELFSTNPHLTYGGGIRFRLSKKEKVNLRLDFAGNERSDFATYLTLKEAF